VGGSGLARKGFGRVRLASRPAGRRRSRSLARWLASWAINHLAARAASVASGEQSKRKPSGDDDGLGLSWRALARPEPGQSGECAAEWRPELAELSPPFGCGGRASGANRKGGRAYTDYVRQPDGARQARAEVNCISSLLGINRFALVFNSIKSETNENVSVS